MVLWPPKEAQPPTDWKKHGLETWGGRSVDECCLVWRPNLASCGRQPHSFMQSQGRAVFNNFDMCVKDVSRALTVFFLVFCCVVLCTHRLARVLAGMQNTTKEDLHIWQLYTYTMLYNLIQSYNSYTVITLTLKQWADVQTDPRLKFQLCQPWRGTATSLGLTPLWICPLPRWGSWIKLDEAFSTTGFCTGQVEASNWEYSLERFNHSFLAEYVVGTSQFDHVSTGKWLWLRRSPSKGWYRKDVCGVCRRVLNNSQYTFTIHLQTQWNKLL